MCIIVFIVSAGLITRAMPGPAPIPNSGHLQPRLRQRVSSVLRAEALCISVSGGGVSLQTTSRTQQVYIPAHRKVLCDCVVSEGEEGFLLRFRSIIFLSQVIQIYLLNVHQMTERSRNIFRPCVFRTGTETEMR